MQNRASAEESLGSRYGSKQECSSSYNNSIICKIFGMSKRSKADTRVHAFVRDRQAESGCYYYPVGVSFMDMSKRASGQKKAVRSNSGRVGGHRDSSFCSIKVSPEDALRAKKECSSSYKYSIIGAVLGMSKRAETDTRDHAFVSDCQADFGCHHCPVHVSFLEMSKGANAQERTSGTGSGHAGDNQDSNFLSCFAISESALS